MRGGDLMRRSLLSPAGGVLACLLFLPGSMSFTGPPPLLGGQHPRLWNCRVGRAGGRVFICVPHGDGGLRGSRGLQATGSATGPALASKLLAGEAGGTGVEAGAVRVFDGAVPSPPIVCVCLQHSLCVEEGGGQGQRVNMIRVWSGSHLHAHIAACVSVLPLASDSRVLKTPPHSGLGS